MVQLSHPYMTTGKTIVLARWTWRCVEGRAGMEKKSEMKWGHRASQIFTQSLEVIQRDQWIVPHRGGT